MEEIWEVIKSVNPQQHTTINTEISNKGNVRLIAYYRDKEIKKYDLSLGKGLYIKPYNGGYEIYISGCSGKIYRYVYFMKYTGHKQIKGWQVHHIDYNHCNNSIDNLLYCSAIEHGRLHKFQYKLANEYQGYQQEWTDIEHKQLSEYNKALEYYSWLDSNKDTFSIDNAKEYIHQIRNEINKLVEQCKSNYKKQKEQNKIKKAEQKYLNKLNSGIYKEVDGKLVRIIPEWQKERMAEGRRRNCYNNPEWRNNIANKNKIGISKGTERKYIDPTELNRYIEQGWHKGFKL